MLGFAGKRWSNLGATLKVGSLVAYCWHLMANAGPEYPAPFAGFCWHLLENAGEVYQLPSESRQQVAFCWHLLENAGEVLEHLLGQAVWWQMLDQNFQPLLLDSAGICWKTVGEFRGNF